MKTFYYKLFALLFIVTLTFSSCSSDDSTEPDGIENPDENGLTDYQKDVVTYFKEVALGFEFGNASRITRKWNTDMKVFVGGTPSTALRDELDRIIAEINALTTDGFMIEIVQDQNESNYFIFFGSGNDYASIYPDQSSFVVNNWGLFSVFWNGNNELNGGHMYVDIVRANEAAQKHLLREELTQSLGLARDSSRYQDSIFQAAWTTTNEYATIDTDLIRLLYHPEMEIGLDDTAVETLLIAILTAP